MSVNQTKMLIFFKHLTFYQVEDYCIFLISEEKKSTPFSSKLRNTLIAIFLFINHQCKLKNNDKNHVKSYHSKKNIRDLINTDNSNIKTARRTFLFDFLNKTTVLLYHNLFIYLVYIPAI